MATVFKFYGISFFEIEAQGRKILIDPCITANSLCPITVDDVLDADTILVTHGAPDHMGDAIEIQRRSGAVLVCGPGVRVHALSHGVDEDRIICVLWGDLIEVGGIGIQCVECRHVSFFRSGDSYISGLPLSLVITTEQGTRVYNVGDSALFSDMRLIGELYRPNVALVPIGGRPDLTGGWTHLAPREASLCVQWVAPELVIPTHFDPHTSEADQFKARVKELAPTVKVEIIQPGEAFTFSPRD